MQQRLIDRTDAGRKLADKLGMYKNSPDTIVLGLPRGGVPVAYEIALKLNLPLDMIIVRKLGHPGHEEYAIGAITFGGVIYINPEVRAKIDLNSSNIQAIIDKEQKRIFTSKSALSE